MIPIFDRRGLGDGPNDASGIVSVDLPATSRAIVSVARDFSAVWAQDFHLCGSLIY